MAFSATFTADFGTFNQAIRSAIPNVDLFEFKIKGTQSALQRMVSEIDGSKIARETALMVAAVEKVGGVTKLTTAEQQRLTAALSDYIDKAERMGNVVPDEYRKIAAEAKKTVDATDKAGGSTSSLTGLVSKLGPAVAGAFSIGAITSFAKSISDMAGEIQDTAQKLAISTDAVQELKFAAEGGGASIDTVATAMARMSDQLSEGDKGTVKLVKDLGLNLNDLRTSAPDAAFTKIAEAIKEIPEPMRQTELTMQAFGKSGTELLPLIRDGVADLRKEAHNLNQVLDKESIKTLDDFSRKWETTMTAAKVQAASAALSVAEAFSSSQKLMQILSQTLAGGSAGFAAAVAGAGVRTPGGHTEDINLPVIPTRATKDAEAAAEAAAKAIKALADALRGADLVEQIKSLDAAFKSLTPQQRDNAATTTRIVEAYGKLRAQVGPGALPRDLEAFYRAHLPVIGGVTQLIDVTGRYATAVLPDLSRRTQEARNMLAGLTAEGLIPTSKAFGDLFDKMKVPVPDNLKGIGATITQTKTETINFGAAIDDLARSWSQLAQIRPLEGWIQDVAELIQLMSIGQQVGQQFADILTKKDKNGNVSFNWSNLMGGGGAGNAIASYAGLANAGIQGYTAIAQATDVQGRGNRAARGAIAGASIGANPALAAATGGWSVVIGAVAGAIVGALRNPGFEQEMKRIANEFGVNIGEKLAREIDKLKKQFGGDRNAAEIFSIDKIIKDAGGLSDQNIKAFTGKLRDVFVMVDVGKFAVEDARNVLDRSFGLFAENLRKSESIASKSFQDIIRLNKEFGVNSEAVQQFVSEQTSVLGGSVANLAAPLVQRNEDFKRQIEEQQKANTGATGSEEQARGQERLNAILAAQKEFAAGSADEFERLGVIAVGAFNAAVNSGADWLTAVENMGPALDTLLQLQKDLGIESQNAGLAELTHFRDLVNNNQALVLSTQALGETMQALSSIGGINIETLKAMEDQGVTTFARLTAAGFTEQQALRQMRGFLMNVIEAHEQLGTPIDENTQKLIDQAKEAGILKKDADSMLTVMKTGFADVVASLDRVARGLGIVIPEAVDETRRALDGIPRDIGVNVHIDYNDPGHTPDISGATASNWDGPSMANGGVGNFGRGTLAMLHGREAIIPLDRMGVAGRSTTVRVPVYLDGRMITEVVAQNLGSVLAFHGAI